MEVDMGVEQTCPECGETMPESKWKETEVGCEDCGSHMATECPKCGEVYDLVYDSQKLEEANRK